MRRIVFFSILGITLLGTGLGTGFLLEYHTAPPATSVAAACREDVLADRNMTVFGKVDDVIHFMTLQETTLPGPHQFRISPDKEDGGARMTFPLPQPFTQRDIHQITERVLGSHLGYSLRVKSIDRCGPSTIKV